MLNAAAGRRTSSALTRTARTPILPLRTIAFSRQPQLLQHTTKPQSLNAYNTRILPPISLRNVPTTLQTRSLSYIQRTKLGLRQASKGIWRKYPFLLPFAIISVIGSVIAFAYIAYIEVTQNMPQYQKFPPSVAKHLRTAVWYTDVDLNAQRALQSYKDALRAAAEERMHPFSDEVLGIRLQISMMLEKAGQVPAAVQVLERTKAETLAWIQFSRKAAAQRKEEDERRKKEHEETSPGQNSEITDPEARDRDEKLKKLDEYEAVQRSKAMKKAVGMSMKLGDLYESDYIQDPEKAEAAYEAAVELSMKELQYREKLGLPISGGENDKSAWLTRVEVAVALTHLAQTYAHSEKRLELAIPLYLRALDLFSAEEGSNPSCKQALLMSNIAGTMAGRAKLPFRTKNPEASRAQTMDASRQWSLKTLDFSAKLPSNVKDNNCDGACTLAMYNLGELAEVQGKRKEAEKWYRDALSAGQKGDLDERKTSMLKDAVERVAKK
ncbi:TPR domain protein [Aspergillus lucknowensis]|uniref:TPR domain protein n=1 Tax=Aspergillus lucknowensis TaxID=176173 RepID=A0ABR4LDW9_9EURO